MSTLHDIVNGLTIAVAHAQNLAESQPQHAICLKQFEEKLNQAQEALIRKIRPGVLGTMESDE